MGQFWEPWGGLHVLILCSSLLPHQVLTSVTPTGTSSEAHPADELRGFLSGAGSLVLALGTWLSEENLIDCGSLKLPP